MRTIHWPKLIALVGGLTLAVSAHAQVEFRLAFMIEQWMTVPAAFPNDASY